MNSCSICHQKSKVTCGKCSQVNYCSQKCAQKDWSTHSIECIGNNLSDTDMVRSIDYLEEISKSIQKIVEDSMKRTGYTIPEDDGYDNDFYVFIQNASYFLRKSEFMYHSKYLAYLFDVLSNYLLTKDIDKIVKDRKLKFLAEENFLLGNKEFAFMFLLIVELFLHDTPPAKNQIEFSTDMDETYREDYPNKDLWIKQRGGEEKFNRYLQCFNKTSGENLKIIKSLSIASDQTVYLVEDSKNRQYVLKWDSKDSVVKEVENYLRIQKLGGTIPDLAENPKRWVVLGRPALVMEKLLPLDVTDDEMVLGSQLLRTQLPYIHQFAVHADLKPDNIMKRNRSIDGSIPPQYFIIDMDLHTEKLDDGYHRDHFTPIYHFQLSMSNQKTSYRDDLMELYGVMVSMYLSKIRFLQHRYWTEGLDTENMREAWEEQKDNIPPFVIPGENGEKGIPDVEQFLKFGTAIHRNNKKIVDAYQRYIFSGMPAHIADYRWYLHRNVPLGGESPLRVYQNLAERLEDERFTVRPKELGYDIERIKQKLQEQRIGTSCLRCGNQELKKKDAFCNEICRRVFVDYHMKK